MCFIILEMFGGPEFAGIVTDEDGENKIFDNKKDAEAEAAECQEGMVIELPD